MKIINEKDFKDKFEKQVELKSGGLWEENNIYIQYNVPIDCEEKINCPHLGEKYIVRVNRYDGSFFDSIYANCPRVVVAVNEGGCNSTGVCLDCLMDFNKNETQSNNL